MRGSHRGGGSGSSAAPPGSPLIVYLSPCHLLGVWSLFISSSALHHCLITPLHFGSLSRLFVSCPHRAHAPFFFLCSRSYQWNSCWCYDSFQDPPPSLSEVWRMGRRGGIVRIPQGRNVPLKLTAAPMKTAFSLEKARISLRLPAVFSND